MIWDILAELFSYIQYTDAIAWDDFPRELETILIPSFETINKWFEKGF